MTYKEKAIELVNKFYLSPDEDGFHSANIFRAKQSALICINEILDILDYPSEQYDFYLKVKDNIKQNKL